MTRVVLIGLAALVVAGIAVAIFDPDSVSGPDADQQEKSLTKCLRAAGFAIESEIPPAGYGNRNPEYAVTVRRDDEIVAEIYLFDFPEEADSFVDDAKLDADNEDEESTIRRRGTAAVDLDSGASTTSAINACLDKAGKAKASD